MRPTTPCPEASPPASAIQPLTDGKRSDHRPCKLLLVDDDGNLADMIARLARTIPGVDVCAAYTVDAAMGVAKAWRPDAVLTDIDLGDDGRDGFDVATAAKAIGAKVAIMSGRTDGDRRARAAALGVELLAKPLSVASTVRRLLGREVRR